MMKRGAKLIVDDPYNGWEASRADLWLRLRPGADGALALGMIKVMIEEDLYDKEFVEKWTFGFDKLKAEVAGQSLDEIAHITWVPTDKIIKAARMYAAAKPAQMRFGQPLDSNAEAVASVHALASLWAHTGNIDNPAATSSRVRSTASPSIPTPPEEVIQLYGREFVDKMNLKAHRRRQVYRCEELPLLGYVR
jgi:anaerobic selenocysteine-containing dehydrogenase